MGPAGQECRRSRNNELMSEFDSLVDRDARKYLSVDPRVDRGENTSCALSASQGCIRLLL